MIRLGSVQVGEASNNSDFKCGWWHGSKIWRAHYLTKQSKVWYQTNTKLSEQHWIFGKHHDGPVDAEHQGHSSVVFEGCCASWVSLNDKWQELLFALNTRSPSRDSQFLLSIYLPICIEKRWGGVVQFFLFDLGSIWTLIRRSLAGRSSARIRLPVVWSSSSKYRDWWLDTKLFSEFGPHHVVSDTRIWGRYELCGSIIERIYISQFHSNRLGRAESHMLICQLMNRDITKRLNI